MNDPILTAWREHCDLMARLETSELPVLADIVDALVRCLGSGGRVYLCGNGGSAADAQHVAAELVGRFAYDRRALPAVALTVDTSALTAIGNDYGFDDVFARQVDALVTESDLLWAFSTSGQSPNVLRAVEAARRRRAGVIAFTGRRPSRLEQLSDWCFCAVADATARSQEAHQVAYHIICQQVERRLCPPTA